MTHLDPSSPDQLIIHEAFLTRLARGLTRDVHEADDVVQEAYAAALERQGDAPGNLRAWLAGVVRNQARFTARSQTRRRQREMRSAKGDAAPSTADVLAREETRKRVLHAVLALPEPYREVVLLRYMDDLPPRKIARRLAVPVETVRTRLWRAREQLRADLDRKAGGKAGAGLALLAPWLGDAAAAASASAVLGGLLASTSAKVGLVAFAALLLLIAMWQPWNAGTPGGTKVAPPTLAADETGAGNPTVPALVGHGQQPGPARVAAAAPDAPKPAQGLTLHGFLEVYMPPGGGADLEALLKAAHVVAWPAPARDMFEAAEAPTPDVTYTGQCDGQGRFEVRDLVAGTYMIEIRAKGFITGRAVGKAGAGSTKIIFKGVPGGRPNDEAASHTLTVVDAAGAPVVGATVACTYRTGRKPQVQISDAEGGVTFTDLPYVRHDRFGGFSSPGHDIVYGFVTARKGTAVARRAFGVWRFTMQQPVKPLVLDAPAILHGKLVAGEGVKLQGTRVRATCLMGKSGMWGVRGTPVVTLTEEATVAADGTYAFASIPPGKYHLTLMSPGGLRIDRRHPTLGTQAGVQQDPRVAAYVRLITPRGSRGSPPNTTPPRKRNDLTPVHVTLTAGATVARDLAIAKGVAITGVVRDATNGRPLAGVRVDIELAPHSRMGGQRESSTDGMPADLLGRLWTPDLRNPLSWTSVTTSATGAYTLVGLMPDSRYFIRVHPHGGHSFKQRFADTGAAGSRTHVVHRIALGGSARLTVRSHAIYMLRHGDATEDALAFRPPFAEIGVVAVRGLKPGRWTLLSCLPGRSNATPVVATFEVKAGEQTHVDALQGGDCHVSGRVLREGRAVPGVRVWLPGVHGSHAITDEDGGFDIRFPSTVMAFGLWLFAQTPEPACPAVRLALTPARRGPGASIPSGFTWEGNVDLPLGALEVEVLDASNAPVRGARLNVMKTGQVLAGEVGLMPWKGRTDGGGRAQVTGLRLDGCLVTCTLPGSGMILRRWIEGDKHASRRVEFRVPAPASVRVQVVEEAGSPAMAVSVSATFWDSGLPQEENDRHEFGRSVQGKPHRRVDKKGEVLFANLPPGRLHLIAVVRGAQVEKTIDIKAGEEQSVRLELPAR